MILLGLFVFVSAFISAFVLTYAGLAQNLPADMPLQIRTGIEWIVASSGALNVGLPIAEMWQAVGIYIKLWGVIVTVRLFIWLYHQVPVFGGSD